LLRRYRACPCASRILYSHRAISINFFANKTRCEDSETQEQHTMIFHVKERHGIIMTYAKILGENQLITILQPSSISHPLQYLPHMYDQLAVFRANEISECLWLLVAMAVSVSMVIVCVWVICRSKVVHLIHTATLWATLNGALARSLYNCC